MNNIKHSFVALILVFGSVLWINSVAQESATAAQEQKKKTDKPKSKPEQKVFKPSEEISEDLPVPFPVDI